MNKVYLSGRITGDRNYISHFRWAEEKLKKNCIPCFNPARHQFSDYKSAMRFDIDHLIQECDSILMLTGWEKSPGANAELAMAKAIGIPVFYEEGIEDFIKKFK